MVDMRIEYDDNQTDVVDKVNEALEAHGLKFVEDEVQNDEPSMFYHIECVGQRACIDRANSELTTRPWDEK